ncbi:hypothetical protein RSSM_04659 [Rhodopirellula sallentina SM41]|uniref:Uncharacterized protein n=1 Tax=Rhodopirellula sallentina SM41 TaxID=1263870 RepID=M5TXF6_9BACT|nr:hypothetical protein RSSM_04659 [Rhodopirellula sallentina SM41]
MPTRNSAVWVLRALIEIRLAQLGAGLSAGRRLAGESTASAGLSACESVGKRTHGVSVAGDRLQGTECEIAILLS